MKPVPLIVAALVIAAGAYVGWRTLGGAPAQDRAAAAPPPVPVAVATATSRSLPVYLRGIGTVQALNAVEIHPQVGGILTDLPVREGQEVHRGDVIAVIDPRPLKAALDRATAQLTQDQAQLTNAIADQQRYATLAKSDFASRQQAETQNATVARFQGVVAGDQAAIEEANINLGYSVVHSPLDGRVGLRRTDPGNLIQANATGPGIVSIQQVRPIGVVFTLPETEVQMVRDAMARGQLPVIADSSDTKTQLATGVLLTPDNAINPGTGTMQFKAQFDNGDDRLVPGQFVSTRLQVNTLQGVTIPHEAVQHSPDGLFVFAVKPDKTAERRPVKLLYDDGKTAIIASGVNDNEQVVTSGQSRVGPGARLAFGDGAPAPGAPGKAPDQSASR